MSVIFLRLAVISAVLAVVVTSKRLSDLIFPKGATLSVNVAVSVYFPEKVAKGFAQVLEAALLYPIVEKAMPMKPPPKSFWINPIHYHQMEKWKSHWHRRNRMIKDRQRKNIRGQLENAVSLFGYDGRWCVRRFQCELNTLTKPETLLEDLLLILFKRRNLDCRGSDYYCPFSLLQIILNSEYVNGTLY